MNTLEMTPRPGMKTMKNVFTTHNHVVQNNYPNTPRHCSNDVRTGDAKRQEMKHLIYILLLAACNGGLSSKHIVKHSPDGKDSIVVVSYFDGKQYNNIYMNPHQFKVLYDDGGYESVY